MAVKMIGRWLGMAGEFGVYVRDTLGLPPTGALVLLAIGITAWVGAAAWAAAIAEIRREDPGRHFLLGLLVPFVYPFLLLVRTPQPAFVPLPAEDEPQVRAKAIAVPKMVRGVDRPGRVAPPAPAPVAVAPPPPTVTPPSPAATPAADVQSAYDEAYFRRLKEESRVSAAAPCIVRYGGTEVEARVVLDVRPEVVTLEVRQAGGSVQRMRVPYAKIESVVLSR